ncbi:DUF485 domain-containing protein [Kitasatospora sp. NPDC088351]|uniref:DUF485 domain-containing protein n=1 Tax=Kitasatospora sp. NPDC088351 TaxID=3155180 RepID=UPI00343D9D52
MESPSITTVPTEVQLIDESREFCALRHSFRSFAFPVTIGFVLWYLLYILLSSYAPGLMGTRVVGHINVALVLGLLQFVTTFAIAAWYARYADRRLDPPAAAIREAQGAVVHAPREAAE